MFLSRTVIVLHAFSFLLCLGPARAQDDHLLKYSTPDVRLYTDIGKKGAEKVIEDITFYEIYIDGFFQSFGITAKKSNPIRIYLYANQEDFDAHRSREHTVGPSRFAYFSPNNNRIVATAVSRESGSRRAHAALRRECARQILHRYFSNPPPAWFDEGFSVYFEGLEFDEHRNLLTDCNDLSKLSSMKNVRSMNRGGWARFFDERPLAYEFTKRGTGANSSGGAFTTLAWGVVFFYLHQEDAETRKLFEKFIQGMNTGRERSKLLMEDILERENDFLLFFKSNHQEIFQLYIQARKLYERKKYRSALPLLLKILQKNKQHVAALRLAAEVSFADQRYEPSLSFWRQLAELDPKEVTYKWRICRCLVESGRARKNQDTLDKAVKAGEGAVRMSGSQNPDCLAALAMALHAKGKLQDALATMRKATRLGGPSHDAYKKLEKAYSQELIDFYKNK